MPHFWSSMLCVDGASLLSFSLPLSPLAKVPFILGKGYPANGSWDFLLLLRWSSFFFLSRVYRVTCGTWQNLIGAVREREREGRCVRWAWREKGGRVRTKYFANNCYKLTRTLTITLSFFPFTQTAWESLLLSRKFARPNQQTVFCSPIRR